MAGTVPSAAVKSPLHKLRLRGQHAMSAFAGWLADRKVPTFLRAPLYKAYALGTGADIEEARGPLRIYPSLSAFFVRHLVEGARPIDAAPERLVSPVDGKVQAIEPIQGDRVIQAKGRDYGVREFLGGVGTDIELEGAMAWTLYLGPKDYHRIHSPEAGTLTEIRWLPGSRYSVAPDVLATTDVLGVNERCILRLETERGPVLLGLVGALNVGRIRVVGAQPGEDGTLSRTVERGEEIARFELGSTVVMITPPDRTQPASWVFEGEAVQLGAGLGRWLR